MDNPDLSSPKVLRAFIQRHGLAPRKGLGQHWLCSSNVVSSIIGACSSAHGILEIGPGAGVLTGPLSEIAPVVAIDVDGRVERAVSESAPKAHVVIADVLTADLSALLNGLQAPRFVVSNLPYYITGAVLQRLCELSQSFDTAVLMMQEEVAARIAAVAGDSERGSLSVLVQHSFEIATVCKVPPTAFVPPPKVESRVLALKSRNREYEPFLDMLRSAFRQPRKTLANNLAGTNVADALKACGLDLRVRPHQLSEDEWRRLAVQMSSPS